MDTPFTPRNAAKYAVKFVIAGKVADVTADVITDYTRFDEDNKIVDLSSGLVGWYVADKLKPLTDKMVDKTADFIVEKRAARKAKKDTAE